MFIVGDLSMNDTQLKLGKDGLKWVKKNLMNKLPFPVYALNGNHDNGTDEQWVNIFGYKKILLSHLMILDLYVLIHLIHQIQLKINLILIQQ